MVPCGSHEGECVRRVNAVGAGQGVYLRVSSYYAGCGAGGNGRPAAVRVGPVWVTFSRASLLVLREDAGDGRVTTVGDST